MKATFLICVSAMLIISGAYGADSIWTFDSDAQGWNSPPGTWNTTITWTNTEGHNAPGSILCTDADVWCGVRNTVSIGAGNPSYQLNGWVKIISWTPATYTLNLSTWNLDNDFPGGTANPYDITTTGTWQVQSRTGTAGSGLGTGYIMINSNAPWGATDPGTFEWYVDDVSYDEAPYLGVSDWSLYAGVEEGIKE